MSLPLDELIKQFIKLTFVKYASTSENLKDLGHFLQQFAQGTTSEINPRKNESHNLYLSNCDSFFSVRIKLDLNFVSNILFLLTILTHLTYIGNGKKSCSILQWRKCMTLSGAVSWCHPSHKPCLLDVR